MPGGYLDIDLRGVEVRAGRYWSFRLAPDPALDSADEGALVEELRSLLSEATRLRLEADVPLGFFLSGGIDSSALLALATRHVSPERLQAFTIGFNETSFDESAWAAAAARAAGVRHAVEVLDFSTAAALVPEVLGRLDEPLADASIVPTYLLSRFARRSVTVALSGDGGDELFAGYDPFRALAPASLYRRLVPKPLHKLLRRLADVLPLSEQNMSLDFKLRRALAGAGFAPPLWNPVWMAPAEPDLIAELFEEPLRAEDLYAEAIDQWESSDPRLDLVDRTLEFYANFYLPNDILMKLDRASMMVSLESRTVFLDNDVVAFCQRLPNRFKFRHGMGKYLLRKALAPLVPKDILRRPKKGFGIPAAAWLRQWNPPDGARLAPHVKLDVLHRLWQEHRARKRDHRLLLWAWLSADAALAPPTAAEKFAISAMP
jgi:asparagine synthase (glutamine-hydrolysing)